MKFITNKPIGEDLFANGSQKRISESIATQIQSDKCKIIGIDGGSGSGKSNVVEIVKKELQTNDKQDANKYNFFIYDVWGHQQDLQRRAILESLVKFLCDKNLLNSYPDKNEYEKDWDDALKILTGKTVRRRSENVPKISYGLLFSFLLIILLPVFEPLSDELSQAFGLNKIWILLWPLELIILTYFWYVRRELKVKSQWKAFPRALENMLAIYSDKKIDETATEFTHESNPSVFDFSAFLDKISKSLKANKHIVLVFDNMDRLPAEKVKELWASLHILFADREICPHKNLHVLIPFDREHVRIALTCESIEEGKSANKPVYGDDYINKTFDIVYRVALQIMSDWKEFFKKKWFEAEGEGGEEYNRVIQIYEFLHGDIRPRSIIVFINEMVSEKMIHPNIPLRYIALFVAKKQVILANPISEIIEKKFLGKLNFIYDEDEDLSKNITALVYQIDSRNAMQIIFTQKLKDALIHEKKDDIEKISKTKEFLKIFDFIFDEIIQHPQVATSLEMIPDECWQEHKQRYWDDFWKKIKKMEKLPSNIDIILPYQESMLKNISQKESFADRIIKDMTKIDDFKSKNYFWVVKAIDMILKPFGINIYNLLPEKTVSHEDFLELLLNAKNEYGKTKISCNIQELDKFLAGKPVAELQNVAHIKHSSIEIKKDLKNFHAKLCEHAKSCAGDINLLSVVIDILHNITDEINNSLLTDQQIQSAFVTNNEGPQYVNLKYALLTMRIARTDSFNNQYRSLFDADLQSSEISHIEKIAEVINTYISFDDLLLKLGVMKRYPTYTSLINYLIEANSAKLKANIKNILTQLDSVILAGNLDAEKLLCCLSRWEFPTISDDEVKQVLSRRTLSIITNSQTVIAKKTNVRVQEYFDGFSEEAWEKALKNIDNEYGVIEAMYVHYKWNATTSNAVNNTLTSMSKGSVSLGDIEQWQKLINDMVKKEKHFTATFNTVRDTFTSGIIISVDSFKFFGGFLLQYANLEERKESLRTIFPVAILKEPICIAILKKYQTKIPAIVTKAGDEFHDFKEHIIEEIKKNPQSELKFLADILKLTIAKDDKATIENDKGK